METRELSKFRKFAIIGVLSLALAIIILDGTILNVSFSYILKDLNTDIKSLQWVITAYSLTIAALTVTGGRLGDLFGRKKMFILGAILFAVGSFIASISNSVGEMVIGESIIEGIGAALMMPATASLLASTFKGQARALAFGVWGGVAGAASAIGPVIGGYLTTNYSWRWGFRINIFVVLLLVIGSFVISEYRDTEEKTQLDIVGFLLSSLGLTSLVFGIIESSTYGWIKAKETFTAFGHAITFGDFSIVGPALIVALILLVLFVLWENRWEKKGRTPIVSMKIFQNRQFTTSVLTVMLMALAQAGLLFSIPIYFQAVRGLDAFHTGLVIMPASLTALVIAPITAILTKKISPKLFIHAGIIVMIAAMYYMYRVLNIDTTSRDLLPAMIMFGLGIGFMMAQINNIIMSSVSVQQSGEVSGVNNTMRQIGSSLGAAIIGSVLLAALSTNIANGLKDSPVIPEPAKAPIEQTVAKQSSTIEFYGAKQLPAGTSEQVKQEITRVVNQATTDSNRETLLYSIAGLVLALIASLAMPGRKQVMETMQLSSKDR